MRNDWRNVVNYTGQNSSGIFRLFVAVEMPVEVIQKVLKIQEFLKQENLFKGTYIPQAGMHLTLKFLGDISRADLPRIDAALKSVFARPMPARLGSVDVFTHHRKISILFLHVTCPELTTVAERIDAALADLVAPEKRSFLSHLTIARVKSVDNPRRLREAVKGLQIEPLEFTIREFVLKESVLSPEGSTYFDVQRYYLGA
jgi:2'-5' RNA ligase